VSGNGAASDKYVIGILVKGMTGVRSFLYFGRICMTTSWMAATANAKTYSTIAMMPNVMVADKERCLAAGMDGYISQTSPPEQLFRAIEDSVLVRKET
jgi:DNA-binding NarL/FixJ family response regulator